MPRQRIVVSVTWGQCNAASPHLGELTIFKGTEDEVDEIMRQNKYTLFRPRRFYCLSCRLVNTIAPTALMIEDIPLRADH